MTKIITIVGARPQFIKASTVSRALRRHGNAAEVLVHTGQHYDNNMSAVFFEELGLAEPDYNLGIRSTLHGEMTARMLQGIEQVLLDEKPDRVLVYGDTNSTLAGALAAAKLHIPVAHVEAGLRSWNRQMPEEINRIVADQIGDLLFAPTPTAEANLKAEGFPGERVILAGDVMMDASYRALESADCDSILHDHALESGSYGVATMHRAENTDDPDRLHAWMSGLEAAARDTPLLFPLHPRTRDRIERAGKGLDAYPSIRFTDPLGYVEMTALLAHARIVATDSGGLQKEAYFHRRPSLLLRKETEWVELLDCGWSRLAPPESDAFAEAWRTFTPTSEWSVAKFGDGKSAERIADMLA